MTGARRQALFTVSGAALLIIGGVWLGELWRLLVWAMDFVVWYIDRSDRWSPGAVHILARSVLAYGASGLMMMALVDAERASSPRRRWAWLALAVAAGSIVAYWFAPRWLVDAQWVDRYDHFPMRLLEDEFAALGPGAIVAGVWLLVRARRARA